jgi:outer membrane protein TolC
MQAEEAVNIYAETKALLDEVLRVNKRLVEADKATPEIVYDAEYELSKLAEQEAVAHKNVEVSRAWFNFLLNREQDAPIKTDDDLKDQIVLNTYDAVDLQDQALSARKELNQLRNGISASNQLLQMKKSFHLPTVNFVADAGYQGFGYNFDSNQDYWLAQFSLRWNLFQGMQNKAKVQQQKIAVQELDNQFAEVQSQIKLEVRQAHQNYLAAQKAIITANASLESVRKSFRINQRKFQEGQGTYIAMIDARTKFTNARFSQLIAQYTLLEKQALLDRALGI